MVYLLPTSDQIALSDHVATFLGAEFPLSRLRDTAARHDLARWQSLIEYGLTALSVPAASGGSDLPLTDEMLVFKQLGHALISPSVLATAMACRMAAAHGDAAIATAMADGSQRACLALTTDDDAVYLVDGEGAHVVLLGSPGALRLYPKDAFAEAAADSLDDGVSLTRSTLPAVCPLFSAGADDPHLTQFVLLCAALLVGIAEHARDLAVDYAKVREQFGRPIGAFQAIKHRCADMAVRVEIALAQLYRAAVTAGEGDPDGGFHASAALRLASRAAIQNAAAAIQVHGGIGFTAECDVHWLLKRAHLIDALNVSPLAGPGAFLRVKLSRGHGEQAND